MYQFTWLQPCTKGYILQLGLVPQPGDEPEPPDDFDDWVDNLYGLMHMINNEAHAITRPTTIATFIEEVVDIK